LNFLTNISQGGMAYKIARICRRSTTVAES
jgi:hypothetical protein